jgi:hypothetical protein
MITCQCLSVSFAVFSHCLSACRVFSCMCWMRCYLVYTRVRCICLHLFVILSAFGLLCVHAMRVYRHRMARQRWIGPISFTNTKLRYCCCSERCGFADRYFVSTRVWHIMRAHCVSRCNGIMFDLFDTATEAVCISSLFLLCVSFIRVLVGCAVARACEFGGRIMQTRISRGQT